MTAPAQLLIVDDDAEIRDLLEAFLSRHGFAVRLAADGTELDARLRDAMPDLIVLDLMLPGEDGLSLCRRLRQDTDVPVIMLTALDDEADRIVGLEVGADDYLAKPFNPRELLARIRAVLRRTDGGRREDRPTAETPPVFRFAGWALKTGPRELVDPEGALVSITTGEYDLLLAFVERPGRVLSRDQLMDALHGREAGPFDRSIDVQLSRLRRKLEPDPKDPSLIKTVRGGGYLLAVDVRREGGP